MPTPENQTAAPEKSASLLQFLLLCGCLSLAIYGVFLLIARTTWPANWQRIVLVSILVCNAATIPPVLLTWGHTTGRFGITTALFTTLWRMATLIAVVILWTATKWLPSEFTALTLVGCYFPFLLLESWHSIKKSNG